MKLVPKPTVVEHGEAEDLAGDLAVGQWYWVTQERDEDESDEDTVWLGCIVHIGSNYAAVEGLHYKLRVHFDEFFDVCERCSDYEAVIAEEIGERRQKLGELLQEVQRVLGSIGIKYEPAAEESQALVALHQAVDLKKHKAALIKAKDEQLPDLFSEISEVHEQLARWMTAKLIPVKAESAGMQEHIEGINDQIFAVELYAGLGEHIHRISKGKPAAATEKLHLMQRLHFMDEECLLSYEAGGMRFENIKQFDRWLKRKANRDRLMPFPRCVLAFRVRRYADRHLYGMISLFEADPDVKTFLYIRNGTNLYRMDTGVEFGGKLFPDEKQAVLGKEKLWAKHRGSDFTIIPDRRHKGLHEEFLRQRKAWRKKPKQERKERPWDHPSDDSEGYDEVNTDNVYYDDVMAQLRREVDDHNRIVLILQGLFDRSPILHPHPPVKLWEPASFDDFIELVYDTSRAIVPANKPDFEAYRKRLNASLRKGSVTVGQQEAWRRWEYEKLTWRHQEAEGRYEWYRGPSGNPGPGVLARITKLSRDQKKASFRWQRERRSWGWRVPDTPVTARFTANTGDLLNVDAYTPGDFLQFFEDPRTRRNYLKWAPLLLTAEDYHAGKRGIDREES